MPKESTREKIFLQKVNGESKRRKKKRGDTYSKCLPGTNLNTRFRVSPRQTSQKNKKKKNRLFAAVALHHVQHKREKKKEQAGTKRREKKMTKWGRGKEGGAAAECGECQNPGCGCGCARGCGCGLWGGSIGGHSLEGPKRTPHAPTMT